MREILFQIKDNEKIARDTFRMTLLGDTSDITAPGQFVNIRLDGFFLRRPISVCDTCDGELVIIYKVVGEGTSSMSGLKSGTQLSVLSGLGNGYDISVSGNSPLLIGGGVGVPPLYYLARKLIENGKKPVVSMGFNTKDEVFLRDEFERLGCKVLISTADGSVGTKGFVTDIIRNLDYDYFYACGPEPMLRVVHSATVTDGELSFEERMGCGFGACMGCSCKTVTGYKRICTEGPVLKKGEIIWQTQE